jgi:hypothetical protein
LLLLVYEIFNKRSIKIWEFLIVARVWAGGTRATPFLLAALFAKRKTKFGGGESEGGAGIHFPHTPFSSRPARAFRFGFCRAYRGNQSGFCSKKVRTLFSNCDHTKLDGFCGQFVCSLAPPAAGLRSHFSAYLGIKSNGRTKSKISFLSSRRRFGAAKPPEQKHTIKKFIELFLLSNFFRVSR